RNQLRRVTHCLSTAGLRPALWIGSRVRSHPNFRAYLSLSPFYNPFPVLYRAAPASNLQPVAMRISKIAACLAGLCVSSASAQQLLRTPPAVYAGQDRIPRVGVRPPGIRLGLRKPREVALAPLSGTEVAILTGP